VKRSKQRVAAGIRSGGTLQGRRACRGIELREAIERLVWNTVVGLMLAHRAKIVVEAPVLLDHAIWRPNSRFNIRVSALFVIRITDNNLQSLVKIARIWRLRSRGQSVIYW
jgi:hypothetical protein